MNDELLILLSPMKWFVLHPWRIALVMAVMLSPVVLPVRVRLSRRRRWLMSACVAPWVVFAYTEATTAVTSNIRVDLVLTVPVCTIALVVWVMLLASSRKKIQSEESKRNVS